MCSCVDTGFVNLLILTVTNVLPTRQTRLYFVEMYVYEAINFFPHKMPYFSWVWYSSLWNQVGLPYVFFLVIFICIVRYTPGMHIKFDKLREVGPRAMVVAVWIQI